MATCKDTEGRGGRKGRKPSFKKDGEKGREEKGRKKGKGEGERGGNSPWPAHFSDASAAYALIDIIAYYVTIYRYAVCIKGNKT